MYIYMYVYIYICIYIWRSRCLYQYPAISDSSLRIEIVSLIHQWDVLVILVWIHIIQSVPGGLVEYRISFQTQLRANFAKSRLCLTYCSCCQFLTEHDSIISVLWAILHMIWQLQRVLWMEGISQYFSLWMSLVGLSYNAAVPPLGNLNQYSLDWKGRHITTTISQTIDWIRSCAFRRSGLVKTIAMVTTHSSFLFRG